MAVVVAGSAAAVAVVVVLRRWRVAVAVMNDDASIHRWHPACGFQSCAEPMALKIWASSAVMCYL